MTSRVIVAGILIILMGYGLTEAWPLITGPRIVLTAPANDATVEGGVVTVSGTVFHEVSLALDGAPVLPDEKGAFSSTLAFPEGSSILTLVAKDRFGRTASLTRTIYVP